MPPTTPILALTVVLLTAVGTPVRAQCRPADSTSAVLVRELTRIATGTDPSNQRMREIAKIPQVSPRQVSMVMTKTVCSKALPVYNANAELEECHDRADH